MSKTCPITKDTVLYLDCLDCDDKASCGKEVGDIWDILGRSDITDVKMTGFDQIKTKDKRGNVQDVASVVFVDTEDYLRFVRELIYSGGYTPGHFSSYSFMDTRSPKYNVKVSISWPLNDCPYVQMRKLEKFR